jgi:hypothetical protein
MEQTNQTQQRAGAHWIDLLSPEELSEKFPWLNTTGIALGSYGTQCEGYFDPWSLLSAMKQKVSFLFLTSHTSPLSVSLSVSVSVSSIRQSTLASSISLEKSQTPPSPIPLPLLSVKISSLTM